MCDKGEHTVQRPTDIALTPRSPPVARCVDSGRKAAEHHALAVLAMNQHIAILVARPVVPQWPDDTPLTNWVLRLPPSCTRQTGCGARRLPSVQPVASCPRVQLAGKRESDHPHVACRHVVVGFDPCATAIHGAKNTVLRADEDVVLVLGIDCQCRHVLPEHRPGVAVHRHPRSGSVDALVDSFAIQSQVEHSGIRWGQRKGIVALAEGVFDRKARHAEIRLVPCYSIIGRLEHAAGVPACVEGSHVLRVNNHLSEENVRRDHGVRFPENRPTRIELASINPGAVGHGEDVAIDDRHASERRIG